MKNAEKLKRFHFYNGSCEKAPFQVKKEGSTNPKKTKKLRAMGQC